MIIKLKYYIIKKIIEFGSENMYCTNCGKELDDDSLFCKYCGFETSLSEPTKGGVLDEEEEVKVEEIIKEEPKKEAIIEEKPISDKSQATTIILIIFFGFLGAHDFYLGRYFKGIVRLLIEFVFTFVVIRLLNIVEMDYDTSNIGLGIAAGFFTILYFINITILAIVTIVDLIQIVRGFYKDGKGRLVKN